MFKLFGKSKEQRAMEQFEKEAPSYIEEFVGQIRLGFAAAGIKVGSGAIDDPLVLTDKHMRDLYLLGYIYGYMTPFVKNNPLIFQIEQVNTVVLMVLARTYGASKAKPIFLSLGEAKLKDEFIAGQKEGELTMEEHLTSPSHPARLIKHLVNH